MESTRKLEAVSFSVAILLHVIAFMIYTGTTSTVIPIEYKKIKIRLGNSDETLGAPSEISKLSEVEVRKVIGYEEETPQTSEGRNPEQEDYINEGVKSVQPSDDSGNSNSSSESEMIKFDTSMVSQKATHSDKPLTRAQKIAGAKYGNFVNEGEIQARDYLELLQYTIQQRSSIPRTEGLKLKGQAVLRLSFNRNGQILEYKLIKKTGDFVLDQAAIEVADSLRHHPFPPAPANFDQGQKVLRYDFFVNYDSDKAEW